MTSHHRSLPWLHDITIELQQMPLCWMRRLKMIVGGLVQQLITVVLLIALKREGLGERPKGCRFLVHGLISFWCALGGGHATAPLFGGFDSSAERLLISMMRFG
jgi:hypothetical protein